MTHDYTRHGTTTLFAALNVLDGHVIARCMQHHRHKEFIRFLNDIERAVPAGKLIEAVVDKYATHKHPKVKAWLERHPRWTFHFHPGLRLGRGPRHGVTLLGVTAAMLSRWRDAFLYGGIGRLHPLPILPHSSDQFLTVKGLIAAFRRCGRSSFK
jgi:hypothetical protein